MKEKGDSSEKTEVMEIMDVNTKRSVMAPQNSDFREHSEIHWKVQQVKHRSQ